MQWNELPVDKTRGVITEHRLYFRKYMQASYNVQTIKAGNEYTITGEQKILLLLCLLLHYNLNFHF